MATLIDRFKSAWSAFSILDEYQPPPNIGPGYSTRPDRPHVRYTDEKSIRASIYTRIMIDVGMVSFRHIRTDQNGRYTEDVKSLLNECLTLEPNIDQTALQGKMSIVSMMLEKGVAAIVPVDTTVNTQNTASFDIRTFRVGEIIQWHPRHVRVRLYNDRTGKKEELFLRKETVAIVENPLYSVMNEPNSTYQRLLRKFELLDSFDEATSSGKIDLIIQLPYVIKSEARLQQAQKRRDEIELQLRGSRYGIAYTDGTEKITQLNRPVENNLWNQIKELTNNLHAQLGLTEGVFNGTASEQEMLNYQSRTVNPILIAITLAMTKSFLTRTARTQGQAIAAFRNSFEFVTSENLAEMADKFIRNEILTPNEFRQIIGFKPADDPTADELRNPNLNRQSEEVSPVGDQTIYENGV